MSSHVARALRASPAVVLLTLAAIAAGCGSKSATQPPPPDTLPPVDTEPPPPPPPPPGVVVTIAGNIGSCSSVHDDATARIIDTLPGLVFTAGDNAFPGDRATALQDCFDPSWGRHRSRLYAVLGNHEYDMGNADPAFDYFGARLGPRDLGYYSLDYGDWHIVVLNDNWQYVPFAPGSAQEQWLRADLAASTRQCTLAIWHQPLFLSSNSAGFTERASVRQLWVNLHAAGADVVVNGHQHHYERMTPMDPFGQLDPVRGIRQFNAGTGGAGVTMPTVAIHSSSEVRSTDYGVLKLTLRKNDYRWEFIPIQGESFRDTGTGSCH